MIVCGLAGEGEAVPGVEAHPGAATGARGGRAALHLPADTQGEDQADEGKSHKILLSTIKQG